MHKVLNEALAANDNAAVLSGGHIILQESKRLPASQDINSEIPTFAGVMFNVLSDLLADVNVSSVCLDGTGPTWTIIYDKSSSVRVLSAVDIYSHPKPPAEHLFASIESIIEVYYLIRYYGYADVRKFLICRTDEGFRVSINDPTAPNVWATHLVNH